jgi:hypothetical protein
LSLLLGLARGNCGERSIGVRDCGSGSTGQTIQFTTTPPSDAAVGGSYTPQAIATSGLDVLITVDPAYCSISFGVVSFTSAGTCILRAHQNGNATYAPAPTVFQSALIRATQTVVFTSTAPSPAVVGGATYSASAAASSGLSVALAVDSSTASVCGISGGVVSFLATGTCLLDANQGGSSLYAPAPQVQQSFTVAVGSQSVNFTSSVPNDAEVGGSTYSAVALATSGLTVSITSTSVSICTILNRVVSFVGAGTCILNANQAGNVNFNAAAQVQQMFMVAKGFQVLMFTSSAPSSAVVSGSSYTPGAAATPSGLSVAISADGASASVCSMSGWVVSFQGAGMCVLNANQAGNSNYNAATQVQQSFSVGKGSQTVSFTTTAPGAAQVAGGTYLPSATASSGLTVTLTVDVSALSICSMTNGIVAFVGAGTCILNGNQAGNGNFDPASQAQQIFGVGQGSQAISFTSTAPSSAQVAGSSYTASATSTSGLAVSVTTGSPSICTITGSTVSFVGAGTCILNANQAGNVNFIPAPQVQQTFTVGQGTQTVSFSSPAPLDAQVSGSTYSVSAVSSVVGLAVSIDSGSSSVCAVSSGTVSFIGAGTCVLDANQGGNANYGAATQVQQNFSVGRGVQTVSFTSTAPSNPQTGDTYTVSALSTSGLNVTVTIDASTLSVCSIAGSTVTILLSGTCSLNANQGGNADFYAASQMQQSFGIGLQTQTVTIASSAPLNAVVSGPTYAPVATATSGLAVTLTIDFSSSGVCTVSSGVVSLQAVGNCTIDANQAGNGSFNAAPQVQQVFIVGKGSQVVTFTSVAPTAVQVQGTAYSPSASSSAGLPVVLAVGTQSSAICTISSGTVSFQSVGTCVLNANQGGNVNYNAAAQVQQAFSVSQGSQIISFTSAAPTSAQVAGLTYTVAATASSGLVVSFSVDAAFSSVCAVANGTVSFLIVGTCTLNANQGGNANFLAAAQLQQSFMVFKGVQALIITSVAPSNAVVGGPTYTPSATTSALGLVAVIAVDPSSSHVCVKSSKVVSFIGAGICLLTMNQGGDANYYAAPELRQSFTVGKGDQVVSFTSAPPSSPQVGSTYSPSSSSSSGLAVTLFVDGASSTVCSISHGGVVSLVATGICSITATQNGDSNYMAASPVSQSLKVSPESQVLKFCSSAPTSATIGDAAYVPCANSSAGLAVAISVDSAASSICSISGGAVSFVGPGKCILVASQDGNSNFVAAASISQTFVVSGTTTTTSSPASTMPPALLEGALFNCSTSSSCSFAMFSLIADALARDANFANAVDAARAPNCLPSSSSSSSSSSLLSDCNILSVLTLKDVQSQRLDNLLAILNATSVYLQSCVTQGCSEAVLQVVQTYSSLAETATWECISPSCLAYGVAVCDKFRLPSVDTLTQEKLCFDATIVGQMTQKVAQQTFLFTTCQNSSCKSQASQLISEASSFKGYTLTAQFLGLKVADMAGSDALLSTLDANYLRSELVIHSSTDPRYRSKKQSMYATLLLWKQRVMGLLNGQGGRRTRATLAEYQAELDRTSRSMYTMSSYLPLAIVVPGFVFYGLMVVACVVVSVLGFYWKTFLSKLLFGLVLLGVGILACLRIAFWCVGLSGVGPGDVRFVVLDKVSSFVFAGTISIFVFMWIKAITMAYFDNRWIVKVAAIVSIATALTMFVVTIVFAVQVSSTLLSPSQGTVTDYSEVILATFTALLALCLFALVLVVGVMLKQVKDRNEKRMRNFQLIAVLVGVMLLVLLLRMIWIYLSNFCPGIIFGFVPLYGVGTILPEIVLCGIMSTLVLLTYFQSRSRSTSSSSKSNPSFQSTTSTSTEIPAMYNF